MARDKIKNNARPPGYLMLIAIFNQILLVLGYSIMLGWFKLEDEVLGVLGV